MLTTETIRQLKQEAKYREIIEGVPVGKLQLGLFEDDGKLLEVGWAHHQLGEYKQSLEIMWGLSKRYLPESEIGESARRCYAHGLLQEYSDIEIADSVMRDIPESLGRDNVRMNMMIMAARKGLEIPAGEIIEMITNALISVPYATINGHIINNGALALHEARQQEAVKPYLPVLPALMSSAIGIYRATDTAKNHLAGATLRNSQICEAAGWKKIARIEAEASVGLWRELVSSQGGERYQQNLKGAEAQLEKLPQ